MVPPILLLPAVLAADGVSYVLVAARACTCAGTSDRSVTLTRFLRPVAGVLRSWMKRHRGEDLTASLAQLEQAIREDRHQDLSHA
ncbi:MAG: hypothetical protein ACRDRJ_27735 [Streptosporangiaceae bacterium]